MFMTLFHIILCDTLIEPWNVCVRAHACMRAHYRNTQNVGSNF